MIRNTISAWIDGAILQASEAIPKIAMPVWNMRLRPKRSASDPASNNTLAITTL